MAIAFDRVEKPLRQLRRSLKSLSANPAPEAVHKLRTRARQVEAIAAALPPTSEKLARRLLKSIKSVRKAAGRVRDMDVLAAHTRTLPQEPHSEALTLLLEQLESSRKTHAAALIDTLEVQRKPGREHLKQYASQLEKRKSSTALEREVEEKVNAAAAHLSAELSRWPALTARNLHAFRLKVKELRAVLQLLLSSDQALVNDLGVVKEKIGEWHDWLQLAKAAAEALDAKQHRALLAAIKQTGQRKLAEALTASTALRQHHLERPAKKPPVSERRPAGATIKARRTPAA
ncbi:MAG TPA: CHAD domain-containing protein [Terracidiphilus sp.]|nr:CHAD domain-containing protein [Terracidiphilus sp.]